MSKKTQIKKVRLGKFLKQNRRMPILAMYRTRRRIQSNNFQRDWRHRKLRVKG